MVGVGADAVSAENDQQEQVEEIADDALNGTEKPLVLFGLLFDSCVILVLGNIRN